MDCPGDKWQDSTAGPNANKLTTLPRSWHHIREDFAKFREVFLNFSTFLGAFESVRTRSDAFGHVGMHSDVFGCVQIYSDAFG